MIEYKLLDKYESNGAEHIRYEKVFTLFGLKLYQKEHIAFYRKQSAKWLDGSTYNSVKDQKSIIRMLQ